MEKIVRILKKIKIKNIVILILLLTFNAYAWFIYATRVSSSLSVHVSSWNVEFSVGEDETVTEIVIEVDRIFPGMETYEKTITVKNKGEIKAELGYEVRGLKIMDESYTVGENITMEELENKIKTDYPFKINIIKEDALLQEGVGEGSIIVTVEWPFESGDDQLDTLWGNKAYEYYSLNPGEKSILIDVVLTAQQISQQESTE